MKIKRVLIIGGYGNFGQYITKKLISESNIQLIIAGRDLNKAQQLIENLTQSNKPINCPKAVYLDIYKNLAHVLSKTQADIAVHTSGPYQSQSHFVAKECINHQCHYIDLADARDFVANITNLDTQAKSNNVSIISGASSVPTLTSAIIDKYISEFKQLDTVNYAISSAQRTNQGIATTQAILSYVGKPFTCLINKEKQHIYGWQNLKITKFWGLGYRCTGNCDIPDLTLFPQRYPMIKTIKFQAGIESKFQHIGLYLLSWLVRLKLIKSLQPAGHFLLKISRLFDIIGSNNSGFYMHLTGLDKDDHKKKVTFKIVAYNGDGLYIPCIPSILMVKKLAQLEQEKQIPAGASPCMGYISLDEYIDAFKDLNISCQTVKNRND